MSAGPHPNGVLEMPLADPSPDGATWCHVAGRLVIVPVDDRCPWCQTDHSLRARLTLRQLASLRMLGKGLTRKQIAARQRVSEAVVSNDWREIRMKLGARTTAQALVMLVREGSA